MKTEFYMANKPIILYNNYINHKEVYVDELL